MKPKILKSMYFVGDNNLCEFVNKKQLRKEDILQIVRGEILCLFYYEEADLK